MKGKSIILVGTGIIIGFISCGVFTIKKILENDRMRITLKQIISDKIGWLLFGDTSRTKNRSNISYQSYYESKRSRQVFYDNFLNVIFSSHKDAEDVLNGMKVFIKRYGFVTIADFYDLCGICKFNGNNSKYGWIDIDECEIIQIRAGYKIDLPKPKQID